jgi:hypothetical protein
VLARRCRGASNEVGLGEPLGLTGGSVSDRGAADLVGSGGSHDHCAVPYRELFGSSGQATPSVKYHSAASRTIQPSRASAHKESSRSPPWSASGAPGRWPRGWSSSAPTRGAAPPSGCSDLARRGSRAVDAGMPPRLHGQRCRPRWDRRERIGMGSRLPGPRTWIDACGDRRRSCCVRGGFAIRRRIEPGAPTVPRMDDTTTVNRGCESRPGRPRPAPRAVRQSTAAGG